MMTPVMLLVMLPMLTWCTVLRAPDGTMSIVLSLVPDRRAVPDAAAHRAAARPADVADRARRSSLMAGDRRSRWSGPPARSSAPAC